MSGITLFKGDDGKYIIEAWGTVEVVDKDGELIPVDEFVKSIPQMMALKPKLHFGHTDVEIGEIIDIWKEMYKGEDGKERPGIKIRAKLYDTYRFHNKIIKGVESGIYNMLSAKGFTYENTYGIVEGKPARVRRDVELVTFALVSRGRNPYAYVVSVNGQPIMKGDVLSDPKFREQVISLLQDGIPYSKAVQLATELLASEQMKDGGENTPFAGYKDFADCVAKNKDKSDPEAYCASIMRKVEGNNMNKADEDESVAKAKYPWDQCIRDQLKRGYTEEQAKKICGSIRAKSQGLGKSDNGGDSMGEKNVEEKKTEKDEEETLADRVSRIEESLENIATVLEKLSGMVEKAVIMPEEKAKTDNPPALPPGKGGVDYIQKGEVEELVKGLLRDDKILDEVLKEKGYVKVEKGADTPSDPLEKISPEKLLEVFQKGVAERLSKARGEIPSAEDIAKESLATWG